MSKRYSILAAAVVASGRGDTTGFKYHSGSRLLDLPPREVDDLAIKERSRLGFVDPDEGQLGTGRADSATPREYFWLL
jgi:hypothetical protein